MCSCGLAQHPVHNTRISSLCQAMGYKEGPWGEKLMNWLGNKNLLWNFSGAESAQTTWLVPSCPHAWLQPLLSHHEKPAQESIPLSSQPGPAQSNLCFFQQHLLPGTLSSRLSLRTVYCSSLDTGMDYKLFENMDRTLYRELSAILSKLETW